MHDLILRVSTTFNILSFRIFFLRISKYTQNSTIYQKCFEIFTDFNKWFMKLLFIILVAIKSLHPKPFISFKWYNFSWSLNDIAQGCLTFNLYHASWYLLVCIFFLYCVPFHCNFQFTRFKWWQTKEAFLS